jgi:uncharacterized membrane protein
MSAIELVVLRLIHVLGGIFWVGSAVFTTLFLAPALTSAGPAAGTIMLALRKRHLMTVLPLAAILTILSGARLMWIASAGFASGYFTTAHGSAYAIAGAATIVAFLNAMLVARPVAIRCAALGQRLAAVPEPERSTLSMQLATLTRRNVVASAVTITLLVFGSAGMAVARYLA